MLSTDHFRHHLLQPPSLWPLAIAACPTFTTASRSLCAQAPFPPCQQQGAKNRQTPRNLSNQSTCAHTTTCDLCTSLIGSLFSVWTPVGEFAVVCHVMLLMGVRCGDCGGLPCAFSCLLCESVERRSLSCPEQSCRDMVVASLGTFNLSHIQEILSVQDLHMYSSAGGGDCSSCLTYIVRPQRR